MDEKVMKQQIDMQSKYIDKLEGCHQTMVDFADALLMRQKNRQKWVGLTDEEMNEWTPEIHSIIRAVEEKLKEKNGFLG